MFSQIEDAKRKHDQRTDLMRRELLALQRQVIRTDNNSAFVFDRFHTEENVDNDLHCSKIFN